MLTAARVWQTSCVRVEEKHFAGTPSLGGEGAWWERKRTNCLLNRRGSVALKEKGKKRITKNITLAKLAFQQ